MSKYYTIRSFIDDDAGYTDVTDDKGKILSEFNLFSEDIGIRKSKDQLDIFVFYNVPEDASASYQIARIEKGAETHYWCSLDWNTLAPVVGREFKTRQPVNDSVHLILNLLTSAEPSLQRDHCRQNKF